MLQNLQGKRECSFALYSLFLFYILHPLQNLVGPEWMAWSMLSSSEAVAFEENIREKYPHISVVIFNCSKAGSPTLATCGLQLPASFAACFPLLAGSKQNCFINFLKEWNSLMAFFFNISAIYCFYQVAEGQEICVIEAMKMQNSLVASKTGKVCLSYTPVSYNTRQVEHNAI